MSKRIFVEKKQGFDVEAKGLLHDLRHTLMIEGLESLRIVNRYDIEGVTDEEYAAARTLVFSEPPVDYVFDEKLEISEDENVIAYELLPGQYDQRADSAAVCVQIITKGEKPIVRAAKLIIFKGKVSLDDVERMKKYVINPVEAHEAEMEKPESLIMAAEIPADVAEVEGFIDGGDDALEALAAKMGFAMDLDDLKFCREYFKNTERRNPTFTEMRVIDTYWSDHCRHTTFTTIFDDVKIEEGFTPLSEAFEAYVGARKTLYVNKKKNMCLMDLATIGMKELKAAGKLNDLDESEEINACSINIVADINGKPEPWLVMFKNETHNHPTEIEPFGGAATCLGGAIRDPLSGRSYVYQAMRVTGSGDPRTPVKDALPGKLPQRKITRTAAAGYSSYGNQIGLATGQVAEIYHPGYVAKRMEIGAVVGATPKDHVVREVPGKG
ncbi:MAG: phosphoribosylformylglycinamidine synthase, partial [Clostridia bacterium]